jgi:hypothetical protein
VIHVRESLAGDLFSRFSIALLAGTFNEIIRRMKSKVPNGVTKISSRVSDDEMINCRPKAV